MSKIRLRLSESSVIELDLPWRKSGSQGSLVSRMNLLTQLMRLFRVSLSSGVVLFPILLLVSKDPGVEVSFFIIAWVTWLLGVAISIVVLGGTRMLVDSPGSIQVLAFGLIVILTYMIAQTVTESAGKYAGVNTFGDKGVYQFSALYVMAFLALYYAVSFGYRTSKALADFAKVVFFSILSINIVFLFVPDLLVAYKELVLLSIPITVVGLAVTDKKLILNIIRLAIPLVLLNLYISGINILDLIYILVSFGVITLGALLLNNWQIPAPLKSLLGLIQFKHRSNDVADLVVYSLLAFVIAFIGVVISILINSGQTLNLVSDLVNEYSGVINLVSRWPDFLIGKGISLSPRSSALATIILYQGLVGLVSYVMVFITGVYLIRQRVVKEKFGQSIFVISAMILILVPLLGIFTQVGLIAFVMWWVSLGVISASLIIDRTQSLVMRLVSRVRVWRFSHERYVGWIQVVIVGIVFLGLLYVIPLIRSQIF